MAVQENKEPLCLQIVDIETEAEISLHVACEGICLALSADGRLILIKHADDTVGVYSTNTGVKICRLDTGNDKLGWPLTFATFTQDSTRILTGSGGFPTRDSEIGYYLQVWDTESGLELIRFQHRDGDGGFSYISSAAPSPNGKLIVSAKSNGSLMAWYAAQGNRLLWYTKGETGNTIFSLAFTPDGSRILGSLRDGTVRAWDACSGQELFCLHGPVGRAMNLAVSPDGKRCCSVGEDRCIRVWDLNGPQPFLYPLREHPTLVPMNFPGAPQAEILAMAPLRSGKLLVTASDDGCRAVWDAQNGLRLDIPSASPSAIPTVSEIIDTFQAIRQGHDSMNTMSWELGALKPLVLTDEIAIYHVAEGTIVAWFPERFADIIPIPVETSWAGSVGCHLYILRLEGECSNDL